MRMLVGLGNPGQEYANTKHNVGFMLLDALANKYNVDKWQTKMDALVAEIFMQGEKVLLVKPLTFMNESGCAVGPLLNWYKMPVENLIVAHDDMDIPVGTIRLRKKGSAGGHNGMKSILYHVKDENFPRVRIGIGRPKENTTVVKHVLTNFAAEEAELIRQKIAYLIPAVECIVSEGIDLAMNKYNPQKKK